MKLLRECDVIVDIESVGSALLITRGDGKQKTVPIYNVFSSIAEPAQTSDCCDAEYTPVQSGEKAGVLRIGSTLLDIIVPATSSPALATASSDGLMSADDKSLLDSLSKQIANSANITFSPAYKSGIRIGTLYINGKGIDIYIPGQTSTTTPETPSVATLTKEAVIAALGYTPLQTIPVASTSTLGGIKVGSNLTINDGTLSLTKADVTNALGFTPSADGGGSVTTMVPSDSAVDIYNSANVSVYGGDFKQMTYTTPSAGYCSITGKLTVRIIDQTNGIDANSFSYLNDSSNLGASATIPVGKNHSILFVWHQKAEETTTGTDAFKIRFIPAT